MKIRVLLAVQQQQFLDLLGSLFDSALRLVPLEIDVKAARSRDELMQRVLSDADDAIFVDWELTGPRTPDLVREITQANPRLRVVALLPLQLRQYRESLWAAGACSSVPKEHLDQEWLSSLLCMMQRAISREARLVSEYSRVRGRRTEDEGVLAV